MAKAQSLFPNQDALGLVTDFYELTMAGGYWTLDHNPRVTFEAFVRVLPENRAYLLAAGLEQVIHYVENVRFGGDDVDWLRSLATFRDVRPDFWEFLREFRFRGDLWAIPEGTVVFADEPLIRTMGTILECQLLETYLLTTLNLQTLVATKAARICHAAEGRGVMEFGARRAHGAMAGIHAARAAMIGGCMGTSNVQAARTLGVPPVGTQAHSWIMSFPSELEAFEGYAAVYPRSTVCLIDTHDTEAGARHAARLREKLKGVRLDSGDLLELGRRVRKILDEEGLTSVQIVGSGDLNEFAIRDLLAAGAPFDSFGVGTDLVTSRDAPALSLVYKLVEVADAEGKVHPVEKYSAHKATRGGAKQVYRRFGADGKMAADTLALAGESCEGSPLLEQYIAGGKVIRELPILTAIRDRAKEGLLRLPEHLHEFHGRGDYRVELSEGLRRAEKRAIGDVKK